MAEVLGLNQVGMSPRVEGQELRRPLSRSGILSGEVRTYYGPGQRTTVGGQPQDYTPPEDWVPAGYALRMPQVVWMTADFLGPDEGEGGLTIPNFVEEIGEAVSYASYTGEAVALLPPFGGTSVCSLVFGGKTLRESWTSGDRVPVYQVDDDTKDSEEGVRIQEVFRHVQEIFSDIKKGLLFIIRPSGGPGGLMMPLMAPQDMRPYLGVDFLHIHVGGGWRVGAAPGDPLEAAAYARSVAALRLASQRFRRYSVRLWKKDTFAAPLPPFDGFPLSRPADIYTIQEAKPTHVPYTDAFGNVFPNDTIPQIGLTGMTGCANTPRSVQVPSSARLAEFEDRKRARAVSWAQIIEQSNQELAADKKRENDFYQKVADELTPDLDVRVVGVVSDVSEEALEVLIRAHFNL